jgi:hypothetical protein
MAKQVEVRNYNYNKDYYKDILQNMFINAIIQHEGLEPYQTPFRITSPEMRKWKTIHGFEIDWEKNKKGRKNFIYLKRQEDLIPAIKQQFINYMTTPEKYKLPKNVTIADAIKKFDQTGAEDKLKFLESKGINKNWYLSDIF